MKLKVKIGLLFVSLAVGVAEQSCSKDSTTVDDLIDSYLSVKGVSKETLFTADIPSVIRHDVTFWCCNSHTKTIRQAGIDDPNLWSTMDFRLPVTFVIHGYLENVHQIWIQNMLRELCQFRLTNACGVDWGRLAKFIYPMSAKHTIRVGHYVASFIEFLLRRGVSMDSIFLVGFSLGAHIAGIAGSTLGGRVPLIIGLDPAGPSKTCPCLQPVAERLDPTDAKFVQAIYTCIGYLGSAKPVATQNFYPARGVYPQPWCSKYNSITPTGESLICSQLVAVELFRRTINNQIVIEGTQCSGITAYTEGRCRYYPRDRMGLDSKRIPGKFYLNFDTPVLAIQNFGYPVQQI